MSDLCGQFYKVHHKSPHSLPFTPKALSVQRCSQRKRAHQDCPSDSGKIPHGDTLLLLLSHFSHVRLCATPQTAAHQAPQSLGFSRQEHWSGLPFPSPVHEREKRRGRKGKEKGKSLSCVQLFATPWTAAYQARVLEWGAIAFSKKQLE